MANSSYVRTPQLFYRQVGGVLRTIVKLLFNDKLHVEVLSDTTRGEEHASAWAVFLPNSEIKTATEAGQYNVAPGDPFGFSVFYIHRDSDFEFRHPLNHWERWAQMRVEHLIAEMFATNIRDEGRDETIQPTFDALQKTYVAYMLRNAAKPISKSHQIWLKEQLHLMPPSEAMGALLELEASCQP